jgi:CMP-N-acetylneuraminic acid synthetase
MNIVALLPMKGTSERVPNKNLKNFNGVPLYHIVMSTLLKSVYIDNIYVNTDSSFLKEDILNNFPNRVKVIERRNLWKLCFNE